MHNILYDLYLLFIGYFKSLYQVFDYHCGKSIKSIFYGGKVLSTGHHGPNRPLASRAAIERRGAGDVAERPR